MRRVAVQRMEKGLLARLLSQGPEVGRILKAWREGFLMADTEGRPVYFFGPLPLPLPFAAASDAGLPAQIAADPPQPGCRVWKERQCLFLESRRGWLLDLSSCDGVDLGRKRGPVPPDPAELGRRLAQEIVERGNLSGLAGAADRLLAADGRGRARLAANPFLSEIEPWLQHLLEADQMGLAHLFPQAFSQLAGLGPGLTPSGDDLLTGFLLAHRLCPSPLEELLEDRVVRGRLVTQARATTTLVGAELIACALEGCFGESLYSLWDAFTQDTDQVRKHLTRLLAWGATSGADTLTGLALGLATLPAAG